MDPALIAAARTAAADWALGLADLQPASSSEGRAVFIATSGERQVFIKAYVEGNLLRVEISNLELAGQNGIPVPRVIDFTPAAPQHCL